MSAIGKRIGFELWLLRFDWSIWWDNKVMRVAWRLPRRLVYWALIRAAVESEPSLNPSEQTILTVCDRWQRGRQS